MVLMKHSLCIRTDFLSVSLLSTVAIYTMYFDSCSIVVCVQYSAEWKTQTMKNTQKKNDSNYSDNPSHSPNFSSIHYLGSPILQSPMADKTKIQYSSTNFDPSQEIRTTKEND